MRPPSVKEVGWVVAASIVLTAVHFTDNVLSYDTYPSPDWFPDWFEFVVGASWFLFTAIGIRAYVLYRDGRFPQANIYLLAYASAGLVSLGHFLSGPPSSLTDRGLVSVFVDVAVGTAVLIVAIWSMRARGAQPVSPR